MAMFYVTLSDAMLANFNVMLYYAMVHYGLSCYVNLCYAMLKFGLLCLCYVVLRHVNTGAK